MNWLHQMWFGYVYPSLKGNAPEDAFHLLVFAILGVVIYPPARKFFAKEWNHLHAKLDGIIGSHNLLHAKMDAIIEHHGIQANIREPKPTVLVKSKQD